jgi:hypothetical protein
MLVTISRPKDELVITTNSIDVVREYTVQGDGRESAREFLDVPNKIIPFKRSPIDLKEGKQVTPPEKLSPSQRTKKMIDFCVGFAIKASQKKKIQQQIKKDPWAFRPGIHPDEGMKIGMSACSLNERGPFSFDGCECPCNLSALLCYWGVWGNFGLEPQAPFFARNYFSFPSEIGEIIPLYLEFFRARANAEPQLRSTCSRLRSRLRGCKNLHHWGCTSLANSYLARGCRLGTRHYRWNPTARTSTGYVGPKC